MSEATIATPVAEPLGKRLGIAVASLVLIFAFTGAWIYLGGKLLHLSSFYASFVFAWYWGISDRAEFSKLPSSLIGCLLGLAVAWQLSYFIAYGTPGLAVGVGVIAVVLFCQIMHWGSYFITPGTMLFLAVFTAPQLLGKIDALDAALTTVAGALYMAAVIFVLKRVTGIK